MNKKSILMFLVAATLSALLTQSALAAYTVKTTGNGGDINGFGPYQAGLGGEFTFIAGGGLDWVLGSYGANAKNYSQSDTFQSFCLEVGEHITAGVLYNAVINNGAINGGGSVGNKDLISQGTAWLYYQFAKGTLSGLDSNGAEVKYNYVTGRLDSAAALQNTIWWLEEELWKNNALTDPGSNNIFRNAVVKEFGGFDNAKANIPITGEYAYLNAVKVLNLTTSTGDVKQDQLVVTPIPTTIWLMGAGLVALVGIRRRVRS